MPRERCVLFTPPCPDEVLGLDPYGSHLTIFGAFLNVLHELLLLVFQLDPFPIQLTLGLLKCPLVLSKPFCRRHALSESPFYDLQSVSTIPMLIRKPSVLTFMVVEETFR